MKLAVSGCRGRMGQRIVALALDDKNFKVTTILERADHPEAGTKVEGLTVNSDPDKLAGCDCLIEFTSPQATLNHLDACVRHGVKMVIGTTGLEPAQVEKIKAAAKKIPIVYSSNMSIGVNILFKMAEMLSTMAPANYTVNMTEAHHIHKKDAPSGTAKTLRDMIEKASDHKVVKIDAIREGEIIGDHKVVFESGEDIITIKHHAKNRDIFAKGSLVAAKFLQKKSKGLYQMTDVLGLS